MTMLPRIVARLTLGVALATFVPCAAHAAESKDPAPRQTEEPKDPEEQKTVEEKKQGREKPSPAAKNAPLRFTDDDLQKYHGRPPASVEEDEIGKAEEASGAAVPKGPRPVTRPSVRPPGIAARPQDDPLKPFRDREAKEKFRAEQIQTMRDRIASLQTRLDYLNAKKNALQNPAPLLAGQTRGPGAPPTPIQGPGKVAIGGFFPPLPPPQTDEDRENDKKMKVKDLIDQVDKEIASVQAELETARSELVSVETRFAQEGQSR